MGAGWRPELGEAVLCGQRSPAPGRLCPLELASLSPVEADWPVFPDSPSTSVDPAWNLHLGGRVRT